MSYRFSICVSAAIVLLGGGCTQVRGRKRIQEANELYRRGKYTEAVALYEEAEGLVPDLPTLWLNKGYTCRQLIAPGGKDAESRRAAGAGQGGGPRYLYSCAGVRPDGACGPLGPGGPGRAARWPCAR